MIRKETPADLSAMYGIRSSPSTIRTRSTGACATRPRSTTTSGWISGRLSRFDDVQAAAKDWETYSSSIGGLGNDIDDTYQLFLPAGDLAGVDPPLHTRLRGALRLAFSPSALRPDSSRSSGARSRS